MSFKVSISQRPLPVIRLTIQMLRGHHPDAVWSMYRAAASGFAVRKNEFNVLHVW
jgi:hypothetical protein